MIQVVMNAVTPADKIVPIAADNMLFENWKYENSYLLTQMGVDTELNKEAKTYSPLMLKLSKHYERKFGKPRRSFNLMEDTELRRDFEQKYMEIKTDQLSYMDSLLYN